MLCGATVFPTSDVRTNIIFVIKGITKRSNADWSRIE